MKIIYLFCSTVHAEKKGFYVRPWAAAYTPPHPPTHPPTHPLPHTYTHIHTHTHQTHLPSVVVYIIGHLLLSAFFKRQFCSFKMVGRKNFWFTWTRRSKGKGREKRLRKRQLRTGSNGNKRKNG